MIRVLPGLSIPDDELTFTASRSGGPGGQHVNKVNSRVTLTFDVNASTALSNEQKRRVRTRLARRVSSAGIVRVVARASRSQLLNRDAAEERLGELLRAALAPTKLRIKTSLPATKRRSRVEEKRHHSEIKKDRVYRPGNDE